MNPRSQQIIDETLRDLAPQALAALIRRYGDFDSCEDAVQEALVAAAAQWPAEGMPRNPRGWLIAVATRRWIELHRNEMARKRREESAARSDVPTTTEDDELSLFLLCCHPALSPVSQVALTLRAVGGLSTAEIARAFLVPESTMGQRISRAKGAIRSSGAEFRMPPPDELADRVAAVEHVLYLIFNEGYTATSGPALVRADLTREAIRLTRQLRALMPDDTEVAGLLALMLLTDARRAARTGPNGELIPLDEQVRTRWNQERIAEGKRILERALAQGAAGTYQVQAAIAALHDEAPSIEATDWPQILALYDALRFHDSPMARLSRAIAFAMVNGPAAGLAALDDLALDPRLANHHRLAAARAHLLERAGHYAQAIDEYRCAAQRTTNTPERNYLLLRAARLSDSLAAVELKSVVG